MRASANYYGHRPDADGTRTYRSGFDAETDELSKEEVHKHAEEASAEPGGYGYRIVLSPGEELNAEELRDWSRDVMQGIEEAGGSWVGFVHDDHTEHPHVHVIAFTEDKLTVEDFTQMKEEGDRSAEKVLEYNHELKQDPMQEEQSTQAGQEQGPAVGSAKDEAAIELPGKKEAEVSQSQEG